MALTGAVSAGVIYATIGLRSSLANDTKVANSKLLQLGKKLQAVAVPAAIATTALVAVGTAAFRLADGAGRAADELLDLEQITGLSTTTLQEFKNVTAIAGVSFEQFTKGITTFERKLPELMEGTGRTTDAMERLGVSVFDGTGNLRDMDAITPDILNALSQMENETERNAIAMQLFGRNAEAMLPIIALGAENMRAARDEAHDMGLVIGGESLEAANAFRVEVDKLKAQLATMGVEIGIELIPAFEGFVEILQAMVPHVKTGIRWGRILFETLVLPWIALPAAMKAFRRNFADQINFIIVQYNKVAKVLSKLDIGLGQMDLITFDNTRSELDELRAESNSFANAAEEDAATIEAAYSDIKIPGFAGKSEFIREELERTGAKDIDELMALSPSASSAAATPTISAVTPATITAGTPQATAAGGSIAMLTTINRSIQEGNTILKEVVTATRSISIGGTGSAIGAGVDSTGEGGTLPPNVHANMKKTYDLSGLRSLRF